MPVANQPPHHPMRQKGLALIEVLLSLGLSSVMFLVLFTAQSHSQKVLTYSQQLHYANRLLDQVANQVWAYPRHYQSLINTSLQGDITCLNGRYCSPVAMTQAWAAYWQAGVQQQLPNSEFVVLCNGSCTHGDTISVGILWSQKLAVEAGECQQGIACLYLNITL